MAKNGCKMIILLENLGVKHMCLMFLEMKLMVKDMYCCFDDDDGEVSQVDCKRRMQERIRKF
jgi:hypothetical protein